MSEVKEETASSVPRWTREKFEEEANVAVTDKCWSYLSAFLKDNVEVDDDQWQSVVSLAGDLAKRDEQILEQEKEIAMLKSQVPTDGNKSKQFLVLSVSEVAKDSTLRDQFREKQVAEEPCRGGFIAQKFYLDFVRAAREFELLIGKDEVVHQVAELGKVLAVGARAEHSLFNNEYLDEEAPKSAVVSELFRLAIELLRSNQRAEAVPLLRVTHQQHLVTNIKARDGLQQVGIIRKKRKRETGGSESKKFEEKKALDQIDICAWFVHPNESLGACVLAACEYKPSSIQERERKAQADMYGSNILILHQKQCIVIDIAGANDLADWTVSAYGLVEAEFSSKPHSWEKSPLYSGRGAEAIVLVAHGLMEAQKSFPGALGKYGYRLGPVVGVIDGFVYKVYDSAEHRKPNIRAVRELLDEDAELLSSKDNKLKIVKMKRMESDWKHDVSSQVFHKIIEQLKKLHAGFGPHGDIRLANLLSCGRIIDFDFVGAESYPYTFNSISRDGRRHPDVEKMIARVEEGYKSPLKLEEMHDWFSLGQVMRLFHPKDDSNLLVWDALCTNVEKGGVGSSDCEVQDYPIELSDGDMPLRGTGHTPVKKQPGAL